MSKTSGTSFQSRQMHHQTEEIKYFDNVVVIVGVKPDPSKVSLIKALHPLKDKENLQLFLGMANYLTRYIPDLSAKREPL